VAVDDSPPSPAGSRSPGARRDASGAAARWARLEEALDELLELTAREQEAHLAALAARDAELAANLRRALAAAAEDGMLDRPAGELLALLAAFDDEPASRLGEKLGPFRITGELGRGGMGAVYAAERDEGGFEQRVAVKVLKRGLDTDEVLRRFVAERRILARLEHPHIARLVDGGATADGLPWFAMERVDGEPITRFVAARRLGTRERLALFLECCDAVAFAHRHQVVHRDLKPANVLVDAGGRVKLLDFGIAKLLGSEDAALTRTAFRPMTPQYAAPEQRDGGTVSPRTDVWQLGNLLAELLPAPLPRDLERIVARARHEDPSQRYGSVDELASDVRRYLDGTPVTARGDSTTYRLARFARRNRVAVVAGGLAATALVAGLVAGVRLRRGEATPPLTRFQLLSTFPGSHRQASFSPDGRSIAFLTEDANDTPQVFTRALGSRAAPEQRTRDPRGAHRPRWSPRGDRIVYDVPGRGIWAVALASGEVSQLLATGFNPSFSPNGARLTYESGTDVWIADADGRNARRLGGDFTHGVEKEWAFVESTPAFSADGREVVYYLASNTPVQGDLWAIPLDDGAPRQLTSDGSQAGYPTPLPDGTGLVYSSARRGGLTLWMLPTAGGEPVALTTGTGEDTEAAISRDGRWLIYTNARNLLRLMWLDPRTGERRQLIEQRGVVTHPSFSPDGTRLAVFQGPFDDIHLWTLRPDGSDARQLTRGVGNNVLPSWSADGRWIYYYRFPPEPGFGFARIAAAGGEPQLLAPGWTYNVEHGACVSPDDRLVAYTVLEHGVPKATRIRELATGREHDLALPVLWPRWSPDGRELVGRDRERQLVLCPPSGAACRGLGTDGTEPRWSADGRTIYFVRYAGYHGSRDSRVTPLWKVRADGSGLTHVADLEGPSAVHFFYDVSPTGEIAWASFVAGRQELWLAELDPDRR
jgi:Tol biopolymer transport system component/serine/threonine protein kinase